MFNGVKQQIIQLLHWHTYIRPYKFFGADSWLMIMFQVYGTTEKSSEVILNFILVHWREKSRSRLLQSILLVAPVRKGRFACFSWISKNKSSLEQNVFALTPGSRIPLPLLADRLSANCITLCFEAKIVEANFFWAFKNVSTIFIDQIRIIITGKGKRYDEN